MTAFWLLLLGLAASPLGPRHRVWLEKEVHFLMGSRERERFLALDSEAERDRFIEAFWIGRDRAAHEARLQASDRLFGPRGRFSERGRLYQLLGPPRFREDLARAGGRLVPMELWHYTGLEVSFLPETFYLVFFRARGSGAYRLWRPRADGVAALIRGAEPGRLRVEPDPEDLDELSSADPELALAVSSLVPGGGPLRSQALLANLDGYADLSARERHVEGRVKTSASLEPLEARLVAVSLLDDARVPELHYALELSVRENASLAWREGGGRFRTRFTLMGRLLDGTGLERERWEDTIELDVTPAERRALAHTALSFQGRRFLPASVRRVELALVSEAGASTTVGADVDPDPDASGALPPHLVRNRHVVDGGGERLPFRFGNDLLSPELWSSGVGETLPTAPTKIRVLAREPTDAENARYRLARGLAFAGRGDLPRGAEEMEQALSFRPDEPRYHIELAKVLYASGRYADVLERLGAAESRFPEEADLYVLLAASSEAIGMHSRALDYYQRAIALDPDNAALREARDRLRVRSQ